MSVNVGDLVKFKQGLYTDEKGAIYRVLEVNGDRVIIEYVNSRLSFPPQSVAFVAELELVTSEAHIAGK